MSLWSARSDPLKRSMTARGFSFLLVLLGTSALCARAGAQVSMYPGQDVTVNPAAAGTQVLLYPGGQYMRVVPPLMQPGARPLAPIHLHMPVHRRHVAARPKPAAEPAATTADAATDSASDTVAAPPPDTATAAAAPPPPAKKKPVATEAAATPPPADNEDSIATGSAVIPFSLDGSSSAPPPATPPKPQQQAKKPPPAAPAPQQVASANPPLATTAGPAQQTIAPAQNEAAARAGLAKRSEIIFEANATDPAPSTLLAIRSLAGSLAAALSAGAPKIELEAYGGARHDKSSDARRLSLKRALSVRQLLIDDGVPADKIDVRAMGGVDDKGPADRVDVFIRTS